MVCVTTRWWTRALLVMFALGLSQAAHAATLTLTWDRSTSAQVTGYVVHVGTTSGRYTSTFDVGSATTYTFPNAQAGQQYYFAVTSYTSTSVSALSAEISASSGSPALPPASSTSATTSTTTSTTAPTAAPSTLALFWDPSPSNQVTGYTVHVGTSSGNYTTHVDVGAARSYTLSNAIAGQRYYFAVNAYASGVAGNMSPEVSASSNTLPPTPTPPTTPPVSTPPAGSDSMALSWNPSPSSNVVGYVVHVGTVSGNYTDNYDVGPATSYIFRGATAGQRYYFAVSAYTPGPTLGLRSAEVSGFSNAPPSLQNPGNQSTVVRQGVTLQLAGSDPAGTPVTYSATGLPSGLSLASSTGYISGAPAAAGSYSVRATVSDGTLSASQTFSWTVTSANAAPVLTNPGARTSVVGSPASLQLVGSDANDTSLAFSASGLPPGLVVNAVGGLISGTPTTAGTFTVTARVSDGALSDTEVFAWTTTLANAAPVLTDPAPQTSVVGTTASLQLAGRDPDGGAVTFSATGLPPGLQISSRGLISGTPTAAGSYTVTASISDGRLSDAATFTWTTRTPSAALGDRRNPRIYVTMPTWGANWATSESWLTIGGAAEDDTGVTSVMWASDKGAQGKASGTTAWLATVPVRPGRNVITLIAEDRLGNRGRVTLTIWR